MEFETEATALEFFASSLSHLCPQHIPRMKDAHERQQTSS